MRLLIFTTEYPPFSGGVATFCESLAVGAVDQGAQVTVVAPGYPDMNVSADGDPMVVRVPGAMRSRERTQAVLLRTVFTRRPDVVLVANGKAAVHLARLTDCPLPVAVYLHGSEVLDLGSPGPDGLPPRELRQVREFYSRTRWNFANSVSTAELFRSGFPHVPTPRVVYLGIDPARIAETPATEEARSRPPGQLIVLCVARLSADKGQDVLIRALPEIRGHFPGCTLRLAGDGPCRKTLETLVHDVGLSKSVQFLGDLAPQQLAEEYAQCDVFAMVSRRGPRESFGLVYLEANLFGKAVVAGRTGGVHEAVQDGITGVLVDPQNVGQLASAICDLLSNPERRRAMGIAGRERVLRQFTHRAMAQGILEALHDAPARGARIAAACWALRELGRIGYRSLAARFRDRRPSARQAAETLPSAGLSDGPTAFDEARQALSNEPS